MRRKTVFVVGAGASKDFGFPLGEELAAKIRSRIGMDLTNPMQLPRFLEREKSQTQIDNEKKGLAEAAKDLCGGLVSARSIDRFIQSRMDRPLVVDIGKYGIAAEILSQESECCIGDRVDGSWDSIHHSLIQAKDTWIAKLFSMLHEGVEPKNARGVFKDISFITFNYDKCIERYLRLAFLHVMNLNVDETFEVMEQIEVTHVYGSVGSLSDKNGNGGLSFGGDRMFARYAANSIRTFTEGAADGTLEKLRHLINEAQDIVFLGFGFDPLNLKALFGQKIVLNPLLDRKKRLFGTGMGADQLGRDALAECVDFPDAIGFPENFPAISCDRYLSSDHFRTRFSI